MYNQRRKTALPPEVEIALADLSNGNGLEAALQGVDTVIHLASIRRETKADTTAASRFDSGRAWEQLDEIGHARDVRLRVAFAGDKAEVEKGLAEVEALYCAGPAGGGGIRFHMRPRIAATSCFVPRDAVRAKVQIRESGHG